MSLTPNKNGGAIQAQVLGRQVTGTVQIKSEQVITLLEDGDITIGTQSFVGLPAGLPFALPAGTTEITVSVSAVIG